MSCCTGYMFTLTRRRYKGHRPHLRRGKRRGGLGKRMLCLAIRTLTTEQRLSLETPLRLEACGGKCDENKMRAVLRCTSERELDAFLQNFPASLAEFEARVGRKATLEEKAEMKCEYDKRHALVKYYGQYGFIEEPFGPHGEETLFCTPMITTLGAALRACRASGTERR